MTERIPRSVWGGSPLPPANSPWGTTSTETYLHHTVTAFIEPEETPASNEGPGRPPHLGILWTGKREPNWVGKRAILRRNGLTKWNQIEVRRRGGGQGYVVVKVDPVRQRQLAARRKAQAATSLAAAVPIAALERAAMRQIEAFHRSLGWTAVGYREVGFPSGRLYEGRGERQGAHCPGANHLPSLAMAGDYSRRTPPPKLRALVLERARLLRARRIVGHRQHPNPTSCPGVSDAWLADLNRDI